MTNVFICDDNPDLLNEYIKIVKNYSLMHDNVKLAFSSTDPNCLLDYLKQNEIINGIYFLDIHFPNTKHDGIYYGLKIKEFDSQGKIIFITSHSELSYLALERHSEPFDFIIKDLGIEEIQKKIFEDISIIIDTCIYNSKNNEFISYEVDNHLKKVLLLDLLYIETSPQPHKLIIHTKEYSEEFYGKLATFNNLELGLVRVHRSYVINIHKIVSVDTTYKNIVLENNEVIPLSYKYKKDFKSMIKNLN